MTSPVDESFTGTSKAQVDALRKYYRRMMMITAIIFLVSFVARLVGHYSLGIKFLTPLTPIWLMTMTWGQVGSALIKEVQSIKEYWLEFKGSIMTFLGFSWFAILFLYSIILTSRFNFIDLIESIAAFILVSVVTWKTVKLIQAAHVESRITT